ncbi:MAG: hypothetical protein ACI3XT_01155 [Butyricicoccaceae bacterium]
MDVLFCCHFKQKQGHDLKIHRVEIKDNRTIAAPGSGSSYTYMSNGGDSWVPPYLAGVYAMAKQVKPDLTHDAFTALAVETAYDSSIEWNKPANDPYNTQKMGVLNPTGIIKALRK